MRAAPTRQWLECPFGSRTPRAARWQAFTATSRSTGARWKTATSMRRSWTPIPKLLCKDRCLHHGRLLKVRRLIARDGDVPIQHIWQQRLDPGGNVRADLHLSARVVRIDALEHWKPGVEGACVGHIVENRLDGPVDDPAVLEVV